MLTITFPSSLQHSPNQIPNLLPNPIHHKTHHLKQQTNKILLCFQKLNIINFCIHIVIKFRYTIYFYK